VGITGICVKETKNVFEIVTAGDKLVKVPKEKTLFRVKSGEVEWRVWGDQFCVRSGERAGKRFNGRGVGKGLFQL
jgi:ribonuclease P protein subunit POP4